MNSPAPLVLDTNVLVSALLNPYGAPGRIWDLVLARAIPLVYDDRILLEYEQVLKRSKFGFDPSRVEAVLVSFVFQEEVSAEPWPFEPLPDPDDVIFLEVARSASATLVTGNTRHYPKALRGNVTVQTPSEWLKECHRD